MTKVKNPHILKIGQQTDTKSLCLCLHSFIGSLVTLHYKPKK